jgi:hypothetical protein
LLNNSEETLGLVCSSKSSKFLEVFKGQMWLAGKRAESDAKAMLAITAGRPA